MAENQLSAGQRMAAVAVLAAGAGWGLWAPMPRPKPASAPATEFSAERALGHVRRIAVQPHPAGSAAAAVVRDAIVKELNELGIPAEIQHGAGLYERGPMVFAGHADNVVAKIAGTTPGPAVLLAGHYDSVRLGPGAADDGHAVGVLLETARALKAGPKLRNDIILLFDVEETGLTGVAAFVNQHRWRNDVAVALNFDARGTRGRDYMFQTSAGNGALIGEFAAAAPDPAANSLTYEVYKRLPNDTDFSVFKAHGYAGFDFAFIGNVLAYHTPFDDLAHLDPATVQQAGGYALALARHFANADWSQLRPREPDAVYFSAGGLFVHYPGYLALPFSFAALALLWLVLRRRWGRGEVTLGGTAAGALACAAAAGAAGFLMPWVWRLLKVIHPGYTMLPQGDVYNHDWYIAAYFCITLALFLGALALARRYGSESSFAAGGLMLGAAGLIAVHAVAPGGTYMFVWPLIGGTLALLVRPKRPVLAAVLCLPGLMLILPFAYACFTGLMMRAAGPASALFALLMALAAAPIAALAGERPARRIAPCAAVVALALIGGAWANRFDAAHPREDDLIYVADVDTGQAWWASRTQGSDAYLDQFLGAAPERVEKWPGLPGVTKRQAAPTIAAAAPEVKVLHDATERGKRVIGLRIASQRGAQTFLLQMLNARDVLRGSVEGIAWTQEGGATALAGFPRKQDILYTCPGEDGAEMEFEVRAGRPLKLRILEPVAGLPQGAEFHWQPRGPGLLAAPAAPFNDDTVVLKTYQF
ncbi:MAG: M28 family peptidase [Bryobacteraceae bacterium]